MISVIYKTLFYLGITGITYMLKQIQLLKKEYVYPLEKIIVNFILPCIFLSSAIGIEMSYMLIFCMFIGLFVNIFTMLFSYLITYKESKLQRGTYMIACSGYDVGNFVLPYIKARFDNTAVMYLTSFNITNTMMAMGLTYTIVSSIVYKETHFDISAFIKKLLSSVCFDVYIFIFLMACLHLSLPNIIVNITGTIGSVNAYLVMIMFGLKLEIDLKDRKMFSIIGIRLICALLLSVITMLLPIASIAKKVFIITYFGPLVSVSSIYARKLGYDGTMVANANSLSIS
ncbi:MAG: transporter [Erysipelotrichaceae bacterium]|nr:transporter [Erysipelotrichaceae bacterium]